jgi:hypothetical protein
MQLEPAEARADRGICVDERGGGCGVVDVEVRTALRNRRS